MPAGKLDEPRTTVGARERADRASVEATLAALESMNAAELRTEWIRFYRCRPPKKLSRDVLMLGVAWKVQERALGGFSTMTKRQLGELVQIMDTKTDLAKTRAVSLRPGARLMREWNGETHEVLVVEDGFLWRGKPWRSLSAIAREMTGTQWSGPRFFGIGKAKAERHVAPAVEESEDG